MQSRSLSLRSSGRIAIGSGIIRCRKPGILAKIELRIPFQRPIRFLPETGLSQSLAFLPEDRRLGNEIDTC